MDERDDIPEDWRMIRLGLDAEDPNLMLGGMLMERARMDYDDACNKLMDTDFEADPDRARELRLQGQVAKKIVGYLQAFIGEGNAARDRIVSTDIIE